eukprot:ANDGO_05197.mRNA.1 hypothetical protein
MRIHLFPLSTIVVCGLFSFLQIVVVTSSLSRSFSSDSCTVVSRIDSLEPQDALLRGSSLVAFFGAPSRQSLRSSDGGANWDAFENQEADIVSIVEIQENADYLLFSKSSIFTSKCLGCSLRTIHSFPPNGSSYTVSGTVFKSFIVVVRLMDDMTYVVLSGSREKLAFFPRLWLEFPLELDSFSYSKSADLLYGIASDWRSSFSAHSNAQLVTSSTGLIFRTLKLGKAFATCSPQATPTIVCPISSLSLFKDPAHSDISVISTCLLSEPHCSSRLLLSADMGRSFKDVTPAAFTSQRNMNFMVIDMSFDETSGLGWAVSANMNMTNVTVETNTAWITRDRGFSWQAVRDFDLPCTPGIRECHITGQESALLAVPTGLLVGGNLGTILRFTNDGSVSNTTSRICNH